MLKAFLWKDLFRWKNEIKMRHLTNDLILVKKLDF